mgnify:CR=1 FL=1
MLIDIKNNLKIILEEIGEFKKVYGYEPGKEGIPSLLPTCTISTLGLSNVLPSEITAFDRVYKIVIKAYIKLLDAEDTQADIDNIIDVVINKLQEYPSFNGSCDFYNITSIDVDYLTGRTNPVAVVNFYLDITKETN